MASVYTMHMDAGSNFIRNFIYEDDNGAVMDLSDWAATMQIRETPDSALVLEIEPTFDLPTGTITIAMSPTETSGLTASKYVYQLELSNATTGEVVRILQGKIVVSAEVVK